MPKKLSEMTLQELWQLFPIFLTEHDPRWEQDFLEMKERLSGILDSSARISHIGSTAIPGIMAKSIVDVLAELPKDSDLETAAVKLEAAGFLRMSSAQERISLNLGYTEQGFADKVYHIHLRYAGDNDELYFRDWLLEHPDTAAEYENLKQTLWKRFEHDRDAYTAAKTDFIREYTLKAKQMYAGRYDPE